MAQEDRETEELPERLQWHTCLAPAVLLEQAMEFHSAGRRAQAEMERVEWGPGGPGDRAAAWDEAAAPVDTALLRALQGLAGHGHNTCNRCSYRDSIRHNGGNA